MDLPEWAVLFCREHLGAVPAELLHHSRQMSEVLGLRLTDGREVALKSRPGRDGREATCVEVQRTLAEQGFPCAAPLTGVTVHGGVAIHAEQWLPGGEISTGDDPATAVRYARLLARLVTLAADIPIGGAEPGAVPPPMPNPQWLRWDAPESAAGPPELRDATRRIRERLAVIWLPRVLGHGDWESQNLRWRGETPYAVHDWDSLSWLPEAAIAGAAAGAFASSGQPTLAPIESSAAFLDAYQQDRRRFDDEEIEVAWAVSLWPALHNARAELERHLPPVARTAVREQAAERLERAGA
jgi:Ser/Thr protein kinase RdoA (MazF antagonist)